MSGARTGLNAFAPGPNLTVARATGVCWMLGVGRFGSIFGSAFGGALLGFGREFGAIIGTLVAQRTYVDEADALTNEAHFLWSRE